MMAEPPQRIAQGQFNLSMTNQSEKKTRANRKIYISNDASKLHDMTL